MTFKTVKNITEWNTKFMALIGEFKMYVDEFTDQEIPEKPMEDALRDLKQDYEVLSDGALEIDSVRREYKRKVKDFYRLYPPTFHEVDTIQNLTPDIVSKNLKICVRIISDAIRIRDRDLVKRLGIFDADNQPLKWIKGEAIRAKYIEIIENEHIKGREDSLEASYWRSIVKELKAIS